MKVLSVNFLTANDKIPVRQRETEFNKMCAEWGAQLKNPQAKLGLKIATRDAKKWQRYAIQRKLQKMGHKVNVTSGEGGFFYIVPVKD